jgi:methyltransferase (TIGR00027 family)
MTHSSHTPISDVSDTSFWVAHYRAVESARPDALFQDPFAQALVGERGRQIADSMGKISRYTAWSVISRTVIIDRFIQQALAEGVDAIINLGAGLDTRPYRMDLPPNFDWIEADHPHIIAHKASILKNRSPNCRLRQVSIDLAEANQRKTFLASAAPGAKKVLILTEGVLPYLSPEQVTDLARDLHAQTRFAYWIAEYFHPKVYPYLQNTAWQLKMKNAPFKFYPVDWFGFFKNLGWIEKETRYSGEVALEFKRQLPMPLFARFLMPFLPRRIKTQTLRMSGHVVFKRV